MLKHLIVIVPGIGGSVLADDAGVVWGDTLRRVIGAAREPRRLSISEAPRLRAVGLMGTVGFCPPFQLQGYDGLVKSLVNGLDTPDLVVDVAADGQERNLGADIVAMPFDFRLGVEAASHRLAAEVTARLAHLTPTEQLGRVIVIGHSMGGLVARCWASDPVNARTCLAVLTVGTPHRGATKALDWLVNGVAVGEQLTVGANPVTRASRALLTETTEVLREWPAVYDLLPTYAVVQDTLAKSHLTVGELVGPTARGFLSDPVFWRHSRRAADLHAMISSAWGDPGSGRPATIPFFARDHGTVHMAQIAEGALTVAAADPEWQPNPGWGGDGTVPALSAIPPELGRPQDTDRWHHVADRHVPMANNGAVIAMVRNLVGDDVSAVRGDHAADVRLGVHLADSVLSGDTVTVAARVVSSRAQVDLSGVSVWVTAQPGDRSTEPIRKRADPADGSWRFSFVPPTSGLWSFTVEAVGLEIEPPAVTDTVAVLDPDDMGLS